MVLPKNEIPIIVPLMIDFFEKAKEPGEFNIAHFVAFWRALYESNKGAILCTSDRRGIMGIVLGEDMCSGLPYISERFLYGQGALDLVDEMEDIGKKRGVTVYYLHNLEGLRSKVVARVYGRKGYNLAYGRFIKVV